MSEESSKWWTYMKKEKANTFLYVSILKQFYKLQLENQKIIRYQNEKDLVNLITTLS